MNATFMLGLIFSMVSVFSLYLIIFRFRDYESTLVGYRIQELSFAGLLLGLGVIMFSSQAIFWIAVVLMSSVLVPLAYIWVLVIRESMND